MPYSVNFSDTTKTPITVNDLTVNTASTSLVLVGRNYPNYGQTLAADLVHLLENFSAGLAPANPIEGQLWFDNINKRMLVNDSTGSSANWRPAGGTHVSSTQPTNVISGDLWVDTQTQQLKLYNGQAFVVVGPNNITGTKSGSFVETITDVANAPHYVVVDYCNDDVISIVSTETFIPQQTINGFTVIQPGINISSKLYSAAGDGVASTPAKFYGAASSADSINVTLPTRTTVTANYIARRDISNTYSGQQIVQTDSGLTIGQNQNFALSVTQGSAVLTNFTDGGLIDIKTSNNQLLTTMIRVDGQNNRVGINNLSPQYTLDVGGQVRVTSFISSSNTTSSSPSTGAATFIGGVGIAKNLYIGQNLNVQGITTLGTLDQFGNSLPGSTLLPATTDIYDIGSSTFRFNNIYAKQFNGIFNGTFTGAVSGTVTGSAGSLALTSVFQLGRGTTTVNISGVILGSPVTVSTSTAHNLIDGSYITISSVVGTTQLNAQAFYVKVQTTSSVALYQDLQLSVPVNGTTYTNYASGGVMTIGSNTNDPSEITSSGISFKGSGETIALLPSLTSKAITNRTEVTDNRIDDYLMVYRTNQGLRKVTRTNFLKGESFVPIGALMPYAGGNPPLGYLLCDGSLVSRSTFPDLFQAIGTQFGAGPDSTTFRLPDMRGRFPLGSVNMLNANSSIIITQLLALDANNTNTIYLQDASQLIVNMVVTGLNIAAGTTVQGITNNQVLLSKSINGTKGTGLTFTYTVAGAPTIDLTNTNRVVPEGIITAPGLLGGTGGNSRSNVDLTTVTQGVKNLASGNSTSIGTSYSQSFTNPYMTFNYIIRADVPQAAN